MTALSRLDALAEAWPLLEHYPRPWPEEICRLDLAVLLDRATHPTCPEPLPGRRALAARWGVSDRTARRLLGELGEEGPRPASVPRVSRECPASVPPDDGRTPEGAANCPASVPPVSRECPADVHTRTTMPGCPAPGSESESETRARDLAEDVVEDLVGLQAREEPQHGADRRDRAAVEREIRAGRTRADLELLWRWSGAAPDAEAEACRRSGWRRWRSLLNSSASSRIEAAHRWEAGGCPTGPPPRAAPGRRGRVVQTTEEFVREFG